MHALPALKGQALHDDLEEADRQLLRFTLDAQSYAVDIRAVHEILKVASFTRLPLLPGFVHGLMNLRGAIVPVIDIAVRLGLPRTAIAARTCVVVVELGGAGSASAGGAVQRLGMLVDAVHEVFDCRHADLAAAPPLGTRIDPSYLAGLIRVRGELVEMLDLERALDVEGMAGLIGHHVEQCGSGLPALQAPQVATTASLPAPSLQAHHAHQARQAQPALA